MPYIAEYIWIDAFGNTRSKARTLYISKTFEELDLTDLPEWNFDGSSTGQASVDESEVIIKPVSIYKDPFRKITHPFTINILVLCDCYDKFNTPIKTNTRFNAFKIFNMVETHKPWFGIEQEYVLYDSKTKTLLGWPLNGFPEKQGKYYCGVGADRSFGRDIVEEHYSACLYAGIKISGINEEVLPGQWEFQIGPCEGILCADQLWVARYLLHRICEKHNVIASFDPKPVDNWNGSGSHVNYSTEEMRNSNGLNEIYEAIYKLKEHHHELIKYCGDNSKRLTGEHETSRLDMFTFGVGDRSASVRIPNNVNKDKCGYLEFRVPSADADPYLVTSKIVEFTLLK